MSAVLLGAASQVATSLTLLLVLAGWLAVLVLLKALWSARRHSNRLDVVMALAKDAIVLLNERAEILAWNEGAASIFGHRAAEVLGTKIWSMMPAGHEDDYAAMFSGVIDGRIVPPTRPVGIVSVRSDGTVFPVELSVSTWKERRSMFVLCIFRDVSQRREMEEKLRASTELFEGVLNGASQSSIIGADERGVITVFNRGAERLLGYDASEVCGKLDLVAFHDAAEITTRAVALGVPAGLEALTSAAQRGEAETREWTYVRKDGARIPVSVTVTPTTNKGAHGGFIAVAHDLSKLRQLERRWEWANEAFRAAFDSAPVGVVLTTVEGRCIHANPVFCELSGFTVDELRTTNMFELALLSGSEDDDPERHSRARLAPLVRGQRDVDRSERQMRRADGSALWVSVHTSIVRASEGSEPLLFVTHVEDITQKQDVQNALREALARKVEAIDRLEEIDRTKSEFVSMVSHELRSPITSIIGYLELLRDGCYGDLRPEQGEALEIVERSAGRLQHLVSDLLTLSRLERSTTAPLNHTVVDLTSVAANVTDSIRAIATKRAMNLTLSTDDDVPCVLGDERHLEHVLSNLLTNAVKFTPDGGSVAVEIARQGVNAVVYVRDTGIGIPSEELSKVFTRFYRGQREEVANIQGTGLGLPIVRAIVKEHGGDISITSEVGVGTTVTLVLPGAEDRDTTAATTAVAR